MKAFSFLFLIIHLFFIVFHAYNLIEGVGFPLLDVPLGLGHSVGAFLQLECLLTEKL